MQIRLVEISNFRGIRRMEWAPQTSIACLIGSGDSTKSTILDAIEYTLYPGWSLTFDDCDFYMGNSTSPVEITVTVGPIPESHDFLDEQKFGMHIRGWSAKEGIHDEPSNDDEFVLSVRLRIDNSLEPEWRVITDRDETGRHFSSRDRRVIGVGASGHLCRQTPILETGFSPAASHRKQNWSKSRNHGGASSSKARCKSR